MCVHTDAHMYIAYLGTERPTDRATNQSNRMSPDEDTLVRYTRCKQSSLPALDQEQEPIPRSYPRLSMDHT